MIIKIKLSIYNQLKCTNSNIKLNTDISYDSYFSSPLQALANFWLEKNHNLLNIIIYCPTSILSSKFHTDWTSIGGDNKYVI